MILERRDFGGEFMKKNIKATDVLFIGLAFFATYFGAGNLIFPPMLGLKSGSNWT